MDRVDYVNVDKYLRNTINKHSLSRIEIDAERTLYLTREFATEIESVPQHVPQHESASDKDIAKQREEIIKARAK